MSPPANPRHGRFQVKIASILEKLMPHGFTISECPISTADGVRGADVAWATQERWRELGNRAVFTEAPQICVEVLSPSNSEAEIEEKMALYFDAGAQEVWICGTFGKVSFFGAGSVPLERSILCPDFPSEV